MKKQAQAFTLIELMVTILIVGVLAAVAVPAYHSYIVKARMTEGYQSIDLLTKREMTYYLNNKEFYSTGASNPTSIDPSMTLSLGNGWTSDWLPAAQNSPVFFSYHLVAGKSDPSGTELVNSVINGANVFTSVSGTSNLIRRTFQASSTRCNNTIQPNSLGATTGLNHDWVAIGAVADLNNNMDTKCTALVRLVEASPSTNLAPSAHGIILFNLGD